MVKSKKMNSLKFFIITSVLLSSLNSLSQNNNYGKFADFYIIDTITINNPVIFYKTNQSGKFIGGLQADQEVKFNIKKAIQDSDIYIFGEDLYRFLDDKKRLERYRYPDYGNCKFETETTEEKKGVVYKRFKEKPRKYILGLINTCFYDEKITVYGKKKSVFSKYDKSLYYKIVFPICE